MAGARIIAVNLRIVFLKEYATEVSPPSKGGETFTILSCHKTTLRLTAMGPGASGC